MNQRFSGIFSSLQQGRTNKMSQSTTGHLQVQKKVGGVVFMEPEEEGSLMYRMTSWLRTSKPLNSEGGMEEKAGGGPSEKTGPKREEEEESIQRRMEERIISLEREITSRKEVESRVLAEKEELLAENQRLSNVIGALQIDRKIEMDNLTNINDDLELTKENLKKELFNQKVVIGEYQTELTEKEREITSRKEVESRVLAEKEELLAENQRLSNVIGALQIDRKIEMDNLTNINDDLELTKENLKKELFNQKVVIGEYQTELTEKEREITSRKEVESRVLAEKEELLAENQRLSNVIGALQIDRKIEMDNLTNINDDLELTKENLKKELFNQKVVIGEYQTELTEKEREITSRKEVESRVLAEKEELLAENQRLSNVIGALQIDRKIEMDNLTNINDDLELTKENLKKELFNQKVVIGEYQTEMTEKDQIIIELTEQLEKARQDNRELKKIVHEKIEVIGEISVERNVFEKSLTEARMNDMNWNERYKCLLDELECLKKEHLNKLCEMEQNHLEFGEKLQEVDREKVASIHRLESVFEAEIDELNETNEKQMQIIREMATEKERLEISLTEARMENLTNEGNYSCLVKTLKDVKKEVYRLEDELSKALEEIGELKETRTSIAKERDSLQERIGHLSSSKEVAENRIVQITKENIGLKDELLAANEITSLLKEKLEERDKKKDENKPGIRKVKLRRSGLKISTEMDVKMDGHKEDVQMNEDVQMDVKMDGHKEDVQMDVIVNKKGEDNVVKAEDLLANGHKEELENEPDGGISGLGQVLGRLLASKGAVPVNCLRGEQKLQKEKEEKQKEEKIAKKKPARKPIVFDLEPENHKRVSSSPHTGRGTDGFFNSTICGGSGSHIIFQGAKVGVYTTRDYDVEGHVTVDLDVPRQFHRVIYGLDGRTVTEITRQSGVSLIKLPWQNKINFITISGTIEQVQLAATHIDGLLRKFR
ncbi:putative leucine-rich repeat-containing protein DDB_G0290503 [Palaemon carinicauda]|uniref:putative leucine-rich repeat-containing protein DDB_G0290503 n=1 Tax=Palaemon carinicauda TaxID=392227 RepID=UPI0035B5EE38